MISPPPATDRILTGVPALDPLLEGGLPRGTMTLLAGPPGSGKTILAQQLCFLNARPDAPVLFFTTLSEPAAKLLAHLRTFAFFDVERFASSFHYVDLGTVLRTQGLQEAVEELERQLERIHPHYVVVDSFKVFEDLAATSAELRKFSYDVAARLLAWECTTLLLGEYAAHDLESNSVFSIIDGLITLRQQEYAGEPQRIMQVVKMRGTNHSRDAHPFIISGKGVELVRPTLSLNPAWEGRETTRRQLGIPSVDALIARGVAAGSALMVTGAAGTGKSSFALQSTFNAAKDLGEKTLYVCFQDHPRKLIAQARSYGLDLESQVDAGRVELMAIPQPLVRVDEDLMRIRTRLAAFGANRVVFDSISFFFQRLPPAAARDKVFLLVDMIHSLSGLGLLLTDTPYGSHNINRFECEDALCDGVIILESRREDLERRRYLEVFKMRETPHASGAHPLRLGDGGLEVLPSTAAVQRL